jgi:hypothetical protein
MLLDKPGAGGGGVDLLVFMHHAEAHHDRRADSGDQQRTDKNADDHFHQGETPARTAPEERGVGSMRQIHGARRTTVTDWE